MPRVWTLPAILPSAHHLSISPFDTGLCTLPILVDRSFGATRYPLRCSRYYAKVDGMLEVEWHWAGVRLEERQKEYLV